ncbi:hypothetical protein Tamer19_17630 [Cupriavidus sp. TA19]|nr:hypothetical protein Tamer19_17630 [Cupriavidus sp. TA19]
MASELENYKGRSISVQVTEGKDGRWSWRYTIDGLAGHGQMSESRGCASRELAVSEALHIARCHVDGK